MLSRAFAFGDPFGYRTVAELPHERQMAIACFCACTPLLFVYWASDGVAPHNVLINALIEARIDQKHRSLQVCSLLRTAAVFKQVHV